jgi:hypothetical protein
LIPQRLHENLGRRAHGGQNLLYPPATVLNIRRCPAVILFAGIRRCHRRCPLAIGILPRGQSNILGVRPAAINRRWSSAAMIVPVGRCCC